ncbi:MAG TPA: aldo/keto reductase [Steroidobacteraceae bacterium]|nr:aldo/keto reductase [Steroidobacteraceae bacterium]
MIPRISLSGGYSISRIIKGGWHLAGDHGAIDPEQARRDMAAFVDAGITTFDCADIYTGVELLIGRFRREYPTHAKQVQVHTKFVPDLSDLHSIDRAHVETIIDRSLMRLGMERLDLVQFHWWDFTVPRYVDTALELDRLRRAGKIAHIGVTNFDTPRLAELVDAGVPITSQQVQYSLVDDRPDHGMTAYCRTQNIALLCYGTVCGGFLSQRWLGKPAPGADLGNRSLAKYRLIIEDFGGWDLFQELLGVLARIAAAHGSDIASVATRVILDRPEVAAAIVGAVNASHLAAHARIGELNLHADELSLIAGVTRRRQGPAGDIYDLERDRTGAHGRIMKYELNALPEKRVSEE